MHIDAKQLAKQWRENVSPFRHAVLDDVLTATELSELSSAVASEPHWPNTDEILTAMVSAPTFATPRLQALQSVMSAPKCIHAIGDAVGMELGALLLRSYVYLPGHALLPHRDWRADLPRLLAVVLYVHEQDRSGGDLVLYKTDAAAAQRWSVARRIAPVPGRMVLFEVSADSLHSVEELLRGARATLSGWYHRPSMGTGQETRPPGAEATRFRTSETTIASRVLTPLEEWLDQTQWRRAEVIDRGRYQWAAFSHDDHRLQPLVEQAATFIGAPLRALTAFAVRSGPGDYALSLDAAAYRPRAADVDIVIDLSTEDAIGGAELVWHGPEGNVAVAAVARGKMTIVCHTSLGRYMRRAPSIGPPIRSQRIIIHAQRAATRQTDSLTPPTAEL